MSPSETARKLPFKPRIGREERRVLIERQAAELFAVDGYAAVSMDDVAAGAGVTKPTLYSHFATKQALYGHLMRTSAQEMIGYMATRVAQAKGAPGRQLRDSTRAFFDFVRDRPFAWRMLFGHPIGLVPRNESAAAIHDQARRNIETLLRRLEPSRRKLPDAQLELRAEALKAAQQALAAWWYEHPQTAVDDLVDAVVAIAGPLA